MYAYAFPIVCSFKLCCIILADLLCPVITGVSLHYMNSPTQPQTGAAGTLVAIVATMNVESPKLVLALLPYCARSRLLQCLRIHLGLQKLSLQIYLSSNHYTQFGSGCDHKHTR